MYSTMFPEDCGTRDLFHFHLSQPRNISSLDKIKSMFCRFKKNSLVTSNVIYLMPQVYLYKYQILQLFVLLFSLEQWFAYSDVLYILRVPYSGVFSYRSEKGIICENYVLKCIFSIKMKEIPFVYNYGMPVWEYSKPRLGITQKPRNQLIVGSPETLSFKAHSFQSLLSLFFYFAEAV